MKNILKTFDRTINKIGKTYVESFKNEVLQQNHSASGKLVNTMKYSLKESKDSVDLVVQTLAQYFMEVNDGVPPKQWDLDDVLQWMDDRDSNPNNTFKFPSARGDRYIMAINIARKIAREGTKNSKTEYLSYNGFRKGFIDRVVKFHEKNFEKDIDNAIQQDIDNIFKQLPKQI